jgi:hypothetical protein
MSIPGLVPGKLLAGVAAAAVAAGGCGSAGSLLRHGSRRPVAPAPATASPGVPAAKVAVIREWSTALRTGHVTAAARYFRVPSVFYTGNGPPVELRSFAQVRLANASLPCGARFLSAHREGRYVNALFRLTDRPGVGGEQGCGTGTGLTARTDFLIQSGRIVQWIRAPDEPGDNGTQRTTPPPTPPGTTPGGGTPLARARYTLTDA